MIKGWIKTYRRNIEDLQMLSPREFQYYELSLLLAVWDKRKPLFGTFDARTKVVKKVLNWSGGSINTTKNSLFKKGFYKKADEFRLKITNADLIFGKGPRIEKMIQEAEFNVHSHEYNFQLNEKIRESILDDAGKLANKMANPWKQNSAD